VDIRSDVRRAYIAKGPTQPTGYNFPKTSENTRFLETGLRSILGLKDKAYCFYCYLFKQDHMGDKFGYDAITTLGFDTWKMHTWHFQNMMEESIINVRQHMKILIIKEPL